ncbi:MAG: hypothetical protein JWQ42_1517 [Edaphobacter sp.]|nr:hypothetical protein [Edaphobacter sp.]
MLKLLPSFVLIGALLLQAPEGHTFQWERKLVTDDGRETHDTSSPHPLTWWTRNPLRLDEGLYPLLRENPDDGHIITARDYRVEQKVTTLGVVSGHRIIQVLTTFHAGPRLVFNGSPEADLPPSQWKSLLVEVGAGDRYVEIYRLQSEYGLYLTMTSAAIYGVGQDAILGTNDPAEGNGGGCSDGYWWFDTGGAHAVDFSPLNQAIARALPPNSMYTKRCWALRPEKAELESWVQQRDATCHACSGLGEIYATYRIKTGVAIPVSVRFEPNRQQEK